MDLLDELQTRILPGDGAMGTRLWEIGVPTEQCLEDLCVSQPDLVRRVHEQYVVAGARVIATNSFGSNAVRLAQRGCEARVSELNWTAAQLARECARGKGVYVAGSVGPLGITAEQAQERGIDRQEVFTEQIGALLDGGVQAIFLETFLDLEEMALALYVKQSLHHCPALCSFAVAEDGRLRDGIPLADAFARLREDGADIVGVNCVDGPQAAALLAGSDPAAGPLAAFPSAGLPRQREGQWRYDRSPEDFARSAVELVRSGVRLIGGCCGTTPSHIAAMVRALAAHAAPSGAAA